MSMSNRPLKKSFNEKLLIQIMWIHWRLQEIFGRHVNPASRQKNLLDGLLTMASIRLKIDIFAKLIKLGANPTVENWLPFRMAACAGLTTSMQWLYDLSPPNDHALSDAKAWATNNGHDAACKLIDELRQRKIRAREVTALLEVEGSLPSQHFNK